VGTGRRGENSWSYYSIRRPHGQHDMARTPEKSQLGFPRSMESELRLELHWKTGWNTGWKLNTRLC
jgi:hypothetical protein